MASFKTKVRNLDLLLLLLWGVTILPQLSAGKWERRAERRGGELFASTQVVSDQDFCLAGGRGGEGASTSSFEIRIRDRYDRDAEGLRCHLGSSAFHAPDKNTDKLE